MENILRQTETIMVKKDNGTAGALLELIKDRKMCYSNTVKSKEKKIKLEQQKN